MNLKNKTVLITGGTSGIGLAIALNLIAKGAQVISFDKNQPRFNRGQPKDPSSNIKHFSVDITNSDQIKSALSQMNTQIDILINNAGVVRRGKLLESSEEDFDFIMGVNLKGSWLMLKQAKDYLKKSGVIIQIASRHGIYLPTDPALYAISKAAVIAQTEVLKKTYPEYIVKLICPGPIDTPLARSGMTPEGLAQKMKIWDTPENLAKKVAELLETDKEKLVYSQESWSYNFE